MKEKYENELKFEKEANEKEKQSFAAAKVTKETALANLKEDIAAKDVAQADHVASLKASIKDVEQELQLAIEMNAKEVAALKERQQAVLGVTMPLWTGRRCLT